MEPLQQKTYKVELGKSKSLLTKPKNTEDHTLKTLTMCQILNTAIKKNLI